MEVDAGTGSAAFLPSAAESALFINTVAVLAQLETAAAQPGTADAAAVQLEQYGDLAEYARSLGINPDSEVGLLWVVQEAFDAPLPANYTEFTDSSGRVFYFNEAANQSTWEHPMDRVYRELLEIVLRVRSEQLQPAAVLCAVTEHLRGVHQQALAALAGWSGPYPSEEGDYYYNEALKVSVWETPVAEWENELAVRHDVLFRCLLSDLPEIDGVPGPQGQPGNQSRDNDARSQELLRSLRLDLGVLRRDPNVGGPSGPDTPHTAYHTARSTDRSSRSARSARRKGEKERRSARGQETSEAAHSPDAPPAQPTVFSHVD